MAKKEFTLGGIGGANRLQEQTENMFAESMFSLKFIKIQDIIPNKLNVDFSQTDIEPLARSIADIGLQHNLVVLKQNDGKYRLLSGERRYRAIKFLLDQGNAMFSAGIPCKVVNDINEVEEEIRLLRANTDTRELTPVERRKAILRLLELYKMRKSQGEIKSAYEQLAEDLQMSERQIHKYAATGNLIPALEELLNKGTLTVTDGAKFSALDEEGQLRIAELLTDKGTVSNEDLSEIKKLQTEKETIKNQLSAKIVQLVKEKDELEKQITEQQDRATDMSEMLEVPNVDIEDIVRKKVEAEDRVDRLSKQKQELQEKYNELKEELKKPVLVDEKKLREIKASVRIETALTKMEEEFDAIKSKNSILQTDKELKGRYMILCERMNALL